MKKLFIVLPTGLLLLAAACNISPANQTVTPQPRPKSSVPVITPNPETANWKTYRNERYGFEIKYPNHYWISTTDQTDIGPALESKHSQITFVEFRAVDVPRRYTGWREINANGSVGFENPQTRSRDGEQYMVTFKNYNNKVGKNLDILFMTKEKEYAPKLDEFKTIFSTFKFIK